MITLIDFKNPKKKGEANGRAREKLLKNGIKIRTRNKRTIGRIEERYKKSEREWQRKKREKKKK